MMMDIFGELMSGAAFAGGVNDQYKDLKETRNVGHWFMVFRPDVFLISINVSEDVKVCFLDKLLTESNRGSKKVI